MYFGRALARLCSVVLLLCLVLVGGVSCGDSESPPPASSPPSSAVLDVTPSVLSLVVGASATLKATLATEGAAAKDVTDSATWTSSAPNVASVAAGKVNAVAVGVATISVTSEEQTESVTVTVTATATDKPLVSLSITPAAPTLVVGLTQQLAAIGTYADNSTKDLSSAVVWSSETSTVATIDATGLLTSLGVGTSKITATLGTVTASTSVTVTKVPEVVSIAVTPGNPIIAIGLTQAFTATATMTDDTTKDLTTQATWTSGTPTAASIANTGIATGLAVGTSTITATFHGITGSTLLTVAEVALVSIAVAPANATFPVGVQQYFFATGTYSDGSTQDLFETAVWSSDHPALASISNAADHEGEATMIAQGSVVITATVGAITGSTPLTVSPAEVYTIAVTPPATSKPVGSTLQYTATGRLTNDTYQDITNLVTWESNNATCGTISNTGIGLAISAGSVTFTAKYNGAQGSAVLTVTP